jgi:hypothetical protein
MGDAEAHRNERTRREDHPDWKMAAPRWLLVFMVGVLGTYAVINLRQYVKRNEQSTAKVVELDRRQERQERMIVFMAEQIARGRVDALRWQLNTSLRLMPADKSFQDDARDRLRDAERELSRVMRENGNPE